MLLKTEYFERRCNLSVQAVNGLEKIAKKNGFSIEQFLEQIGLGFLEVHPSKTRVFSVVLTSSDRHKVNDLVRLAGEALRHQDLKVYNDVTLNYLKRVTIAHFRHEFTNYDDLMDQLSAMLKFSGIPKVVFDWQKEDIQSQVREIMFSVYPDFDRILRNMLPDLRQSKPVIDLITNEIYPTFMNARRRLKLPDKGFSVSGLYTGALAIYNLPAKARSFRFYDPSKDSPVSIPPLFDLAEPELLIPVLFEEEAVGYVKKSESKEELFLMKSGEAIETERGFELFQCPPKEWKQDF